MKADLENVTSFVTAICSVSYTHLIRVLGIFMTAVETGAGLDREMIENLPRMLPELAFRTYIRKNIDVKKAPIAMQPLCFFSPRCTATEDYAALTDEMLQRMEG